MFQKQISRTSVSGSLILFVCSSFSFSFFSSLLRLLCCTPLLLFLLLLSLLPRPPPPPLLLHPLLHVMMHPCAPVLYSRCLCPSVLSCACFPLWARYFYSLLYCPVLDFLPVGRYFINCFLSRASLPRAGPLLLYPALLLCAFSLYYR